MISNPIPPRRIKDVAAELGLDTEGILLHGHHIAKIPIDELAARQNRTDGKLILVTAMTPTPTAKARPRPRLVWPTALRQLGKRTIFVCASHRSDPTSGSKAAAPARAGHRSCPPRTSISILSATCMPSKRPTICCARCWTTTCSTATNWALTPGASSLRRVIDLNDRSLRDIIIGLGGVKHGVPRRDGFNITPASEVMAILCLARDYRRSGPALRTKWSSASPTRASRSVPAQLQAVGAMQVLMRDAIHPNLVQIAGRHARVRACRAVRQHRPGHQHRHRHAPGIEAGRLRRDRSRFCHRTGRGEIFPHQMPRRGAEAARRQ